VIRLVRASLGELESLVEQATTGGTGLERVEYPPGCVPVSGPIHFELVDREGLVVRVRPGRFETDDFALSMLFGRGVCAFGSVEHFHDLCRGALARAFGLPELAPERRSAPSPEPRQAAVPRAEQTPPTVEHELADTLVGTVRSAGSRRRRLTTASLAGRLARTIHGQDAALERVAAVVAAQLAKRRPAVPASMVLLGPTGVGKTATVEALPEALAWLGSEAHVHRIDCAELSDDIQLTRVLGVAPGYVGHTSSTELLDALARPGAIVLLDEIEKAHPDLLDALLALLDTGRLTAPSGTVVECPHAIVAMTSNLGVDDLSESLGETPLGDRPAVQRICRAHLVEAGLRAELVGRIGAFAVFGPLDDHARLGAARSAVEALAAEYALEVAEIDGVVLDVIVDLAAEAGAGARGLRHAARDLLAECMADVAGARGRWSVAAGPPPALVRCDRSGRAAAGLTRPPDERPPSLLD
jgi:ATP-dependent Clp protease ATP-binding subunit ClpA